MKNLLLWWKKDARYIILFKALLLSLLPVLCCLVYCAAQGHQLGDVYLPSSEWNDELLYYKQVEGILNYGYPLGYFGYNESQALKLSLGAWSPVLFSPFIIWGFLFGWNLMSPIFCNIVLMSLSCFFFVWLTKPTWKQLGILTLLFPLYTPFVRYMLSGMPEVICFSMLIIFYSLAFNYLQQNKNYKLFLLFFFSALMTTMRPYLLLFMLLPASFWIQAGKNRSSRWKRSAASLILMAATLGVYIAINYYLASEYLEPLFFTDWLYAFFEQGFLGGIRYMLSKINYHGHDLIAHIQQGISTGLASGAIYAGYLVCLGIFMVQSIRDLLELRHLNKASATNNTPIEPDTSAASDRAATIRARLFIEVHLVFCFVAMLSALLLMYSLTDGSKHLLTFIAASVFVISLLETRFYKKAVIAGITFLYLYVHMAINPYDYQVPFLQEERVAAVERWSEIFANELELDYEQTPSYKNSIIWIFNDTINMATVNTQWQPLYALPEGFGISCCLPGYIMEHFNSLQCSYLYVPRGGSIEAACIEFGYKKIAEDENVALFQIP